MQTKQSILFIDADAGIRRGAESALRELAPVRSVGSASEVTTALRSGEQYSVAITTLSLPGMEGSIILEWIRELHPESVRLLTVAKESVRCVSDAINDVNAFRVLTKPYTAELLRRAATDAQDEYARQCRARADLEGTLQGSLEAIAGMLALVQPAAVGRAVRLRRIATLVAEQLGIPNKWDIQVSALLSQFGMVALPPELHQRLYRNEPVSTAERAQLQAATEAILLHFESIPRMARICEVLRAVDLAPTRESLRTGGLKGDAERILTLVLDFDVFFAHHGSAAEALRVMESHMGHYHPPYFDALRAAVGTPNDVTLLDLPLSDVRHGHVFAADVRSPNDLLLVARGQPVTAPILFKIRSDWHSFAAVTMVRVIQTGQV